VQSYYTPFKHTTDDVTDRNMDLLNALGVCGWHDQGNINQLSQRSTVSSQEAQRVQSLTARRFDSSHDIPGIAARADGQEYIARASESSDLACKNRLKTVVVAGCRQERRIRRECQGR
jgi:hypothetical protein